MARKSTGNEALTFLRSLDEQLQAIQEEHDVLIEMTMHRTDRKGVFCFHFEAEGPVLNVGLLCPVARIKGLYPNSRAESLEAFLWGQAVKLDRMVEDFRNEENARYGDFKRS